MKSFKEITQDSEDSLMIVDSLNLAFRWQHKRATKFVDEYLATVDSLRRSYKANKVIIAADGGASTYRREIFPDYKSGRSERFADQTESDRLYFEEFLQEFNRVIDRFKNDGDYPVLKFRGVEADDISAYITQKWKKKYNIWLISTDRDWDLLINDRVSRFSYVTRKEVRLDNWGDHYDCLPDDYISYKCLIGDSGDSIPGVDGVGPKRAVSLVQEYGSAYDIAVSIPIPGKYKYIHNVNTFGADNIIRNYKLMDLVSHCEEAIGETNRAEIDRILGEYL